MYGVLRNDELIAVSENIDEINAFIESEEKLLSDIIGSHDYSYDIILISKKKSKYIKKQTEYEELLLVECSNGQFVPSKYRYIVEDTKDSSTCKIIDVIRTMIVILQSGLLSDKEFKHVLKSAKILNKIQSDVTGEEICLDNLKEIHKLNLEYKERKG